MPKFVFADISFVHSLGNNSQTGQKSVQSSYKTFSSSEGNMLRQRRVVQASQGDGRPCPSQTSQWKPCPVQPCYQWKYSSWSQCQVEVRR